MFNIHAQVDSVKHDRSIDCYVSCFIATTDGDEFLVDTYAGIELGVCVKNFNFSISGGRENIDFSHADALSNYWYELKIAAYKSFGSLKVFVLTGWGRYLNSKHSFIEYGGGLSYNIGKFDLSMQVSRWDNIVYIAPGVCFNFNM